MEAIREWVSKDERYISMVGECEIIRDAVSFLRRTTIEGEKGEEEGMSISEKNGILGIVLEVVEGGGWRGKYEELEEVVGRLEEEGKKRWIEKRREKGMNEGREWKEMGRLAHDVGWAIEERKTMLEGRGEDGEMIMSLRGMKKNLEEEKKKVAEKDKQLEEERRRAYEEKRAFEERISRMEREMEEMKKKEGILYTQPPSNTPPITPNAFSVITSLDGTSVIFPKMDGIKREGNIIIHHGSDSYRNCFIGGEMASV